MFRQAIAALLLFGALATAQVSNPSESKSENDRLIQTAKLWIAIKYFHPYLAYKPIDWDKALIDALPKIRSAQNRDEYASALQSMLDTLHDPATWVVSNVPESSLEPIGSGERTWMHFGFVPESGTRSEIFYSAFVDKPAIGPRQFTLPLAEGISAHVRLAEPATSSNVSPSTKPDSYPDARYPSTEYRILAACKIWGVIHHFFAYRDLMDEDWDEVFSSFLPRFIAAKDAREYNLTVADMLTHTLDSQVTVNSDELADYFGRATVGLRLRLIEKKPVITEILDNSAKSAGLHVGDIVAAVDGQRIPDRFNRLQDYISGSTPQRRGYDSVRRVLDGPEGSIATLLVSQDGPAKEIKLQRTAAFLTALQKPERTGDFIRVLSSNIGYVDLTRLPDEEAPRIFQKLQNEKAIIFDARGEIGRAAQAIASHLTKAKDVAGAIITGPVTFFPDLTTAQSLTSTASYFFVEKLPDAVEPNYTGKTVMLIDERTIGSAEHLGLWLEAANATTFIGTPSAGADGEISNFVIPGGITITFSGQDVRHANAGKLQRLGLQPTVLAAPTINGIRRGRDETLEKAIEYLSDPQLRPV